MPPRIDKLSSFKQLYSCILEPIVSPEFWKQASEPMHNIKIPAKRPKQKKSTRNDIHPDPKKLSKLGIFANYTYYKAMGHNSKITTFVISINLNSFTLVFTVNLGIFVEKCHCQKNFKRGENVCYT